MFGLLRLNSASYIPICNVTQACLQALPTLLVFQNGKQADRIEGNDAGRMLMNGQLLADRLQYLLFSNSSL